MRATLMTLAAAILLVASAPSASVEERVPRNRGQIDLTFAPVVREAAPAVVTIYTRKVVSARRHPFSGDPFFERFFGEMFPRGRERVSTSLGSGVIVDPTGIVVSNHHVVAGADEIIVRLADRREFEGRVILADEKADLAVVQLDVAARLPALRLRESDDLEVGDLLLAIGNPFGVGQTVTSGIVSGLARSVPGRSGGSFIQTDAAINPGNSGGALVDMRGRLVGVPTSILSRSGGSNGIGFAVPANLVARVLDAARRGDAALPRPWLGLAGQQVTRDLAEALGMPRPRGVLIDDLHPRSPLARAGLRAGDVVLALDGAPVSTVADLGYRAATLGPGARATLAYLRDGRRRSEVIPLERAPEEPPRARTTLRRGVLAGVTVEAVNPAVIAERGLAISTRGVIVVAVRGPARRTGLRPGDVVERVDRTAVETVTDLGRALRRAGRSVVLQIVRDGRRGRITVSG